MIGKLGWVYFVHAPEVRRTKIGWTAGNPVDRVNQLRTGSPVELVLCGVLPGTFQTEQQIHRGVGTKHRAVREWFNDHELLDSLRTSISREWPVENADVLDRWSAAVNECPQIGIFEHFAPIEAPWLGLFYCQKEVRQRFDEESLGDMSRYVVGPHAREAAKYKALVCEVMALLIPRCVCCFPRRN